MSADRPSRSSFPLRFHDERTRELLRLVAERQQVSMNQLAEELISRELDVLALGLETTMSRTVELLRAYRTDRQGADWRAFAEAEALPEPVPTRRAHADDDPFGVAQAFEANA
jgi:hypothetical protein